MVGRNDPCPCGSGKKFKKCCLVQEQTVMESLGTPNMATDVLKQLKSQLGDTSFSSIGDVQKRASTIVAQQNCAPLDDFLGLSPQQMHHTLNNPLCSSNDIISLRTDKTIDLLKLSNVPVMKQTLYLLKALGNSEKGIKTTKTNNLPRVLVQSFYTAFKIELHVFRGVPLSQMDLIELDTLVFALKQMGLIKLRTGWISLTRKGLDLIDYKNRLDLYHKLFIFYGDTLDWLSSTGFGVESRIIQRALSFNLFILKKRAVHFTFQQDIANLFLQAFPPAGDITDAFVFLFLDEFCLYFGLVDREGKRTFANRHNNIRYRQSSLFKELFDWKMQ